MRTKSGMIKSRASKPKNFKWQNRERFSMGHDPASFALIPEKIQDEMRKARAAERARRPKPEPVIGVWRSPSLDKTKAELVYESAERLLNAGRVGSVDEAVERATAAVEASWRHQTASETIVEIR